MTDKDTQAPVLTRVVNGTGVLELNRPKALNSLNPDMIHIINETLAEWKDDDSVKQVLVYTENPKAFCAGGDVRYARDAMLEGRAEDADDFFRDEYTMNELIANYPKPYIAVWDGIIMGGGLGISAHASHRITTANAWASMPEMAIGYITDVGVPYMSQRMVGTRGKASPAIAKFWALTGYRMKAADMLWTGLATHYVEDAAAVVEAIIADGVDAALEAHAAEYTEPAPLAQLADAIESTFTRTDWAEIQGALGNHSDEEFVGQVQKLMAKASPSAVVAANELFNASETAGSIREELDMEVRLGEWARRQHDFSEGVRAVLVDKDQDAKFDPATVEEVDVEPIRAALRG